MVYLSSNTEENQLIKIDFIRIILFGEVYLSTVCESMGFISGNFLDL